MKKIRKSVITILGIVVAIIVMSSCTHNLCPTYAHSQTKSSVRR